MTGDSTEENNQTQDPADYFAQVYERGYGSTSAAWLSRGAGISAIACLPLGPAGAMIGVLVGAGLTVSIGLVVDLIRRNSRQLESDRCLLRLSHLLRWADFTFDSSPDPIPLLLNLLDEFKPLIEMEEYSSTARTQLKALRRFLGRPDVQASLFSYIQGFLEQRSRRVSTSVKEIATFEMICRLLVSVFKGVYPRPLLVTRVEEINEDENLKRFLELAAATGMRKRSVRDQDWVRYADLVGLGVDEIFRKDIKEMFGSFMGGRRRQQSWAGHGQEESAWTEMETSPLLVTESPLLQPLSEIDRKPGEKRPSAEISVSPQEVQPPVSEAISAVGSGTSEYRRRTLSSSEMKRQKSVIESIADHAPYSEKMSIVMGSLKETPESQARIETRLFKSFADYCSFSPEVKRNIPIAEYEFEFLDMTEEFKDDDPAWESVCDKDGVRVYKCVKSFAASDVVLIKTYCTMTDIPADVVLYHIRETKRRKEWDTTFFGFAMLEINVGFNEVVYSAIKAPWPIASRDFLQWRRTIIDSESGVIKILHRSAAHQRRPEGANGFVRTDTIISGYIIRPTGPNSCTLSIVAQTDIKGSIPKWVVNQGALRAPYQWCSSLRGACHEFMASGAPVPAYSPVITEDR